MPEPIENPEDAKLLVLARAARARLDVSQGAAVRDLAGRTYAAAEVRLASVDLSAPQLAVAMAVSSGATGLEAAAVVTEHGLHAIVELDPFRDLGGHGVPVYVGDVSGEPLAVRTT